ncbi:MAG: ATP-binding cassette domain-containing protein [Anaerolineae bacterium]|jgi:ABC-2 type transport system ATP-binding protein
MKVVAVDNLHKHYGDPSAALRPSPWPFGRSAQGKGRGIHAVDGISFEIEQGEIFGLLGPNGAGKTTTINVLCTYIEPTAGEVTVAGHSVTAQPEAVKRAIGVVPQEIALYPDLNAVENLRFFGRMVDVPRARLEQRIGELLALVGLTEHAGRRVEHYSGGMKRRLNLAVGLLSEPRFLMLDEPTVGVDPQSRNAIFENIQELNQQGLTILYTTHYMEEAELLCHRVAIMDEGRIIALDTPQNLINTLGTGIIHIGVKDVDQGMAARLQALPQVMAVNRRDDTLAFETVDAQRALLDIIRLFNETDTPMTSLEILEPNLESVFIQLTGKQLRDM